MPLQIMLNFLFHSKFLNCFLQKCKILFLNIRLINMLLLIAQRRKWLTKTGWASSNVVHRCGHAAAWPRLLFCQKLGGQLPTLPTRHLRP